MKKILVVLLCAALMISLAACGTANTASTTDTESPEATASAASETEASEEAGTGAGITFTTTDLDGNTWTQADLEGNTLTMINFWEYWCGPCVNELPELQELSEDYADQGFMILGVFSDDSNLDKVASTVETAGVTYPILNYSDDFDQYQTGYVPTTIFVNASGEVVGETEIGSHTYEEWSAIVEGLL